MPLTLKNSRILPPVSVKTRVLLSFLMVIFVLSASIDLLGYYVIQRDIIQRAERRVRNDLKAARMVYTGEIERIGQGLKLVSPTESPERLRQKLQLHYLRYVTTSEFDSLRSEIARKAAQTGQPIGGTRIATLDEFKTMEADFPGESPIEIKATPMARPMI